eukprot:2343914-Amphidinium_carterae.1
MCVLCVEYVDLLLAESSFESGSVGSCRPDGKAYAPSPPLLRSPSSMSEAKTHPSNFFLWAPRSTP